MTSKTKNVAAAPGASTTPKKPTSKPMKKAFDFEKLQSLVKQREVCEKHLRQLTACAENEEFLEDLKNPNAHENMSEIKLQFGSGHRAHNYTIVNVVLLEDIRKYIKGKIDARKAEIETEIESFG
jgi:hypothetical protein